MKKVMKKVSVKQKLKKGDLVVVITGKDKGKQGEILSIFPAEGRALVAGVNIITKHQKPSRTDAGGIVKKEAKIQLSNVAYLDPIKKLPTKIGFKVLEDGSKVRVAKLSKEVIVDKK